MKYVLPAVACALALALSCPAYALDVESPYVKKGVMKLDTKNRADFDHRASEDGYYEHIFGVGYGMTDWWAIEVDGNLTKSNGDHYRYEATEIETTFVLTKKGEAFLDSAIDLAYEFSHEDGKADSAEIGLLLAKSVGQWHYRANLGLSHEVGGNAQGGVGLGTKAMVRYSLDPLYNPGVEYYGEFGEIDNLPGFHSQGHHLGPMLYGKLPGDLSYEFGWVFGLSDAAEDHIVKLNVAYEFSL